MSLTLKTLMRNAGAALLYRLGRTHPARVGAGCLTIVTFHRVLPTELRAAYPFPGIAVTPDTFAACLDYFIEHYRCLTIGDAWATLQRGPSHPKPLLAITFDDGQADNFAFARPLLAKKEVPATFYVPTEAVDSGRLLWHDRIGFAAGRLRVEQVHEIAAHFFQTHSTPDTEAIGKHLTQHAKRLQPDEREQLISAIENAAGSCDAPDWAGPMTWEQIRALADEGHEIGSHSMTHPILRAEFRPDLRKEIGESRQRLEEILRRPVCSFAYPNGDWDEAALQSVRDAGYTTAVTTRPGRNAPTDDPLLLARHDLDEERFRRRTGGISASVLAWRLTRTNGASPCRSHT